VNTSQIETATDITATNDTYAAAGGVLLIVCDCWRDTDNTKQKEKNKAKKKVAVKHKNISIKPIPETGSIGLRLRRDVRCSRNGLCIHLRKVSERKKRGKRSRL
jgi:hypothetical protein